MKKTVISWRLSFASQPLEKQLAEITTVLEPVDKIEKTEDYAFVFREYGLSEYIVTEQEALMTAGETALHCLTKAHRFGRGWSIMWPSSEKRADGWWSDNQLENAAMPDFLDGLKGILDSSKSFANMLVPGISRVMFDIRTVAEETEHKTVEDIPPVSETVRQTTEDLPEFRIYIKPAIDIILARQMIYPWSWKKTETQAQLEQHGFLLKDSSEDELFFDGQDRIKSIIRFSSDKTEWIEFILAEFHDPHLLEENEFSEKQKEFETLFHNSVNNIEIFLGTPLFVGASGENGFPGDRWADWAAVWKFKDLRIIVEQKHNDPELPMQLCLVIGRWQEVQ